MGEKVEMKNQRPMKPILLRSFQDRFLKRVRRGVGVLCLLAIVGCQVRLQYPSETPSETVFRLEHTYWFWGLLGQTSYELYEYCMQGQVAEVYVYTAPLQSIFTVLTVGIYAPRTIEITCSAKVAAYPRPPREPLAAPMEPGEMPSPAPKKEPASSRPSLDHLSEAKEAPLSRESEEAPTPPKKKSVFELH